MKKVVVIGLVIAAFVWGGVWIYQYLNPADIVINEEIPTFEVETLPTGDIGESDGDSEVEEEVQIPDEPATPPITGVFQKGDSAYTIEGDAVVTFQGSSPVLSLTNFSVSSGPDLFVYLVETTDTSNQGVKDAVKRGDYVNLGDLKGNIGNQNYTVPADIDLDGMVVSIWCKQFGSNFGHARLQ